MILPTPARTNTPVVPLVVGTYGEINDEFDGLIKQMAAAGALDLQDSSIGEKIACWDSFSTGGNYGRWTHED